jgi:prepilin-type N-terminal cleavage/methylation domain-containing protein
MWQKQKGFTIVELMIVLVIAGVIMSLVFLAVPALQRNSRSTQKRNHIAAIAATLNQYYTTYPNSYEDAICQSIAMYPGFDGNYPKGFYKEKDIHYSINGTQACIPIPPGGSLPDPGETIPNITKENQFGIAIGARCHKDATGNLDGDAVGSIKGVVILFSIENGTASTSKQCQEVFIL